MSLTFSENLAADYWFEQTSVGDDDWSELYSLFEHMRDHVGLPYQSIFPVLQEVHDLMLLDKWHGK